MFDLVDEHWCQKTSEVRAAAGAVRLSREADQLEEGRLLHCRRWRFRRRSFDRRRRVGSGVGVTTSGVEVATSGVDGEFTVDG